MAKKDEKSKNVSTSEYKKYGAYGEPFFCVPNKVFELGLTPHELAVLFYLCMRADNENHTCWPSEKTIAKDCGMTSRTVRNCLRSLEEKERIKTNNQYSVSTNGISRQTANKYTLIWEINSAPRGIEFRPPRKEIPPPEELDSGEINKTKSNITKSNITKPTELTSCARLKGGEKKMIKKWICGLCQKDALLCERALERLFSQDYAEHDGVTYSIEELCERADKRCDPMFFSDCIGELQEARGVHSREAYLAKIILRRLVTYEPEESESSFDLREMFEAALRRSYGKDADLSDIFDNR